MEMKVKIPFQQILTVVKTLTPAQKARLRHELAETKASSNKLSDFTQLLLNGPVYTDKQLQTIEETRKSITKWRTKS